MTDPWRDVTRVSAAKAMPISFVIETNMGGIPVTLCSCGVVLYQPMAVVHVEQCAIAAADLPVQGEPPK